MNPYTVSLCTVHLMKEGPINVRRDLEVQAAVDIYQLGLPRLPLSGRSGEMLGRATGSSLEFQEYREYAPGDDIRHLDWAAYARSDTLMVRLYRDEISPHTEVLLDMSRSMTTANGRKEHLARQLAALFAMLSGRMGGRPVLVPLDGSRPPRRLSLDALDGLENLPFHSTISLPRLLEDDRLVLSPRSVRIVISDFLDPHDPRVLVGRLAAGASAVWIVQLLGSWEADPSPLGGRRLIDVENDDRIDLVVDHRAVSEYVARLRRLQDELTRCCRRVHARFVTLVAERGLTMLCRGELCRAGMLRPA